jgi:hypothetical protein
MHSIGGRCKCVNTVSALDRFPLCDGNASRSLLICDLETENVAADLATVSLKDLKVVAESLALRAMQFSLFAKALVGQNAAREIMLRALTWQAD